ncbi:PQQ-binding-like beta-propeller repeat protein [Verrucomicrobium sp. BvORR034]|uniref:outer membrane protein assembly factor BamB family protein n=1 Tax=Verrucomicrobium sp. BvORR034 TaxID=1396418 RepID=UPI002240E957|nr:PQQ-binding-like beta-propeller repeat protein [Verrucomicrobium sp. BvORR034]
MLSNKVYVFDARLERPRAWERLTCRDAVTGNVLWQVETEVSYPEFCFVAGQENGPTSTPVIAAENIYTLGQKGQVCCRNTTKGALVWQRDFDADYGMKEFTGNGSPLVEGELLIITMTGTKGAGVIALDRRTGMERWRALDEAMSNSSPVVIGAADRRQLVIWSQQSVSALDVAAGQIWWSERLLTSSDKAVSTPVWDGDLLLVGGLMFRLGEKEPGARAIWPENRAISHRVLSSTSTAWVTGGQVYSAKATGEFVCLDATTGQEVWKTDKVTASKQGATVHIIGASSQTGEALLYNDQGELILARLSPAGYEERSRAKLLEPDQPFGGNKVNWSAPALAGGRVFVRNQRELVCVRVGR